MTAETIFLARYEKLGQILTSRKQDELIDLALILRQLLVDGTNLVDQVNRTHRLKLQFTIGRSSRECVAEMMTFGASSPQIHLLRKLAPKEPKREVSRDQFLKHEIVKIGLNYYSVHELLDTCANRLGGVHFDPKGEEQEVVRDLKMLAESLERMGIGTVFDALMFMAEVSHAGLKPLYEAVKKMS